MALHHASPGEVVDLGRLDPDQAEARTRALVKTEAFETARLIVGKGTEIPPHSVAGPVILHCLEGCVRIALPGSAITLAAGQWTHLQGGTEHSLQGLEDSALLMTILFGPA